MRHLSLGLLLEEHEYENEKGQGSELAIRRVLVAVHSIGWEGHVLYHVAHKEHQGAYHTKLGADLGKDSKTRLGRVQGWRDPVQEHGHDESRNEAQDADPRTSGRSHNRQHLNIYS
jgi:hypothetical protein